MAAVTTQKYKIESRGKTRKKKDVTTKCQVGQRAVYFSNKLNNNNKAIVNRFGGRRPGRLVALKGNKNN